jgi:hypothetical protein
MPEGLEIDHKKNLNGSMAAYAEQVLICTGKDDWTSRIEEENSGDNLAADIKELIGRGGVYSDVRIHSPLSPSYQPVSRNGTKMRLICVAVSQRFCPQLEFPILGPGEAGDTDYIRIPPPQLQIHPFSPAGLVRFCASACQGVSTAEEAASCTRQLVTYP